MCTHAATIVAGCSPDRRRLPLLACASRGLPGDLNASKSSLCPFFGGVDARSKLDPFSTQGTLFALLECCGSCTTIPPHRGQSSTSHWTRCHDSSSSRAIINVPLDQMLQAVCMCLTYASDREAAGGQSDPCDHCRCWYLAPATCFLSPC